MRDWARRFAVVLALLPAMASWGYAGYAIAQQLQPRLEEENRRIIERLDERVRSHERAGDMTLRRLDVIEDRLFYLILVTAGTSGVVGVDKAGYYLKRRKNGNGN